MGLRDFLRKLGLGSHSGDIQPGVRRARLPQRPPDAPTVRVSVNPGGADPAPSPPPAAPAPPIHMAPPPAPAPPVAPPRTPPPSPVRADAGGATQYISVPGASSLELVGVLAAIDGSLRGQVFTLGDGETRLGREHCDVILKSQRISRYHAKIVHADGAFVIEANPEVADKNPTVVNDQPIDAEALCDGDVIRLGDCTFKFRTI